MNVKEFRENGLLWAVNREVLHPLGLALSVIVNDDGTEEFGDIMETDDPEGWEYGEGEGQNKFLSFMKAVGDSRHKSRKDALGFIVQPLI